jgi:hypothetical protein
MRIVLVFAAAALIVSCAASRDRRIADLERQLQERDREIAELRRREDAAPAQPGRPAEADQPENGGEDMSRALERALVRQGGMVLAPWVIQVEPEIAYTYSEPEDGGRRDTFVSSVTVRTGLPWALQADVYVPYVIYDRQSGVGSSSDLGDIQLAVTKRLVPEAEYVPELLLTGRWKTDTGKTGGDLPTGTGGHALQATLGAVKTKEPIVLFGFPSYTADLPSDDVDYGDTAGAKLGVLLAATPDTSLLLDVDVNSSFATRVGRFEIGDSDRLSGVVEIGLATVLSKDLFLNLTTGIGFTSAAPDFRLAASLPFTRY